MPDVFIDNYGQRWKLLGQFDFWGEQGHELYKWQTLTNPLPSNHPTFWLQTDPSFARPNQQDWNQAIRFRYKLNLPNFPELESKLIYPKIDPFIIEIPLPQFIKNLLYSGIRPELLLEYMPTIISYREPTYRFKMDIRQLISDEANSELKNRDRLQRVETLSLQILDRVNRI